MCTQNRLLCKPADGGARDRSTPRTFFMHSGARGMHACPPPRAVRRFEPAISGAAQEDKRGSGRGARSRGRSWLVAVRRLIEGDDRSFRALLDRRLGYPHRAFVPRAR